VGIPAALNKDVEDKDNTLLIEGAPEMVLYAL
jgi:hypothetical protein